MAKKPAKKKPAKYIETVSDVLSRAMGNKEKIAKLAGMKLSGQQSAILATGLTSRRKIELLKQV